MALLDLVLSERQGSPEVRKKYLLGDGLLRPYFQNDIEHKVLHHLPNGYLPSMREDNQKAVYGIPDHHPLLGLARSYISST